MRKGLVSLVILLILPLISTLGYASTCSEKYSVPAVKLFANLPPSVNSSIIANSLSNFANYYDESVGVYALCFEIVAGNSVMVDSALQLTVPDSVEGNISIENLNISAANIQQPILTILNNSTSKVLVNDFKLSNVKNGLLLTGTGPIEVSNAVITGDANKSGTCVDIRSPNALVTSSDISSCNEGIRIASNGNMIGADVAENYASQKNLIHNNITGIHVVSGTGSRFG